MTEKGTVLSCHDVALIEVDADPDNQWPVTLTLEDGPDIAILNLRVADARRLAGALLSAANELQPHRPIIEGPPPEVSVNEPNFPKEHRVPIAQWEDEQASYEVVSC